MLPFARFLIRHGIAVLGYDKRGVGGSTGDWNTASFEDLAGDVVAAFEYLKTRDDIDGATDWTARREPGRMDHAARRRACERPRLSDQHLRRGRTGAETTIDQAQNEMTAGGMRPQMVEQIVGLMKLQYQFARTGRGWDEYAATREKIVGRLGEPPDTVPGNAGPSSLAIHSAAVLLRSCADASSAPGADARAIRRAGQQHPGGKEQSRPGRRRLKAGGHRDYTLRILPKANHIQLEAKVGNNAEMASLQRFVPDYFTTVQGLARETDPRITAIAPVWSRSTSPVCRQSWRCLRCDRLRRARCTASRRP